MLNVDALSTVELLKLHERLNQRVQKIEEEIRSQHWDFFIQKVGIDTLMKIPVVEGKTLGLLGRAKYPDGVVKPSTMGDDLVLRGLDGANRPFIAIKVDLLDSISGEKVNQVVEVVFKRYSLDGDGRNGHLHGDNYVTALTNTSDDGKHYPTGLFRTGCLREEEMENLGKLLLGETIQHAWHSRYQMRLAD